ncbi:tannase/feruloyl esterase family alpha/beta hydrolase [Rhodococcoides fascians]|uniref:tannase/feruloyl esterase family alpha/beta hydrolase n=1 Tax=Rhodococcoides fascians TaxID=1828 RepID=UPI0012D2D858|nr:tannase/feruloyl esterase family alpha/beta hydrolase [Rhodococcus fascians]
MALTPTRRRDVTRLSAFYPALDLVSASPRHQHRRKASMKNYLVLTAVASIFAAACASTPAPTVEPLVPDCPGLAGLSIPAEVLGMPTTGGEIVTAEQVAEDGDGPDRIAAHCAVKALVHPIDPAAPDIAVSIALPAEWNGNAMMFGGGGYNGRVPDVTARAPFGAVDELSPLSQGYVTFGSDSGHAFTNRELLTPSLDGSFAVNDEALHNFAGDALKKTRDAAVFIIDKSFGSTPEYSYFAGGSTGGREALAVAQRWPSDFQGVISAYPAWKAASLDLWFGRVASLMSRPGAFITPPQQQYVYDQVMAACDSLDGVTDKVISNEAGCAFDPNELACQSEPSPSCLSDLQIESLVALTEPMQWDYTLDSGESGIDGVPFLSGAKLATPLLGLGAEAPANPMPLASGFAVQFWDQWIKYFVTRDPGQNSLAIDPLDPGRWLERISYLSGVQDVNSTDLGAFADAGGKLILVHGTADEIVSHRSSIEYYNRLVDTMGRTRVEDFAKFYLVPGADHANGDAAFAASWDAVGALAAWSEKSVPPTSAVVADANPNGEQRTRPLCEYPSWPKYAGEGNPNDASAFECTH